jgi:uncharacterized membrane protein
MFYALAIILHLISINVWVGGNFFSVVVLSRAVERLDVVQQQLLMETVLRRFFICTWIVMPCLLASGGWMIFSLFGGLAHAPLYIVLMAVFGLLMSGVFLLLFFGPYRRFKQTLSAQEPGAGRNYLLAIRYLSAVNLVLGFCVMLLVGGGPHFMA